MKVASAAAVFLLAAVAAAAADPLPDGPDARTLWERNLVAQRLPDSAADVTLSTTTPAGDGVDLRIRMVAKLAPDGVGRWILARVVSGGTLQGTSLLIVEHQEVAHDLWMFLPAVQQPRRLVASNLGDSFVGSEFRFGDMLQLDPAAYVVTLVGERDVEGEHCWGIDVRPASPRLARDTGLSRQVLWLRQSNLMERRVEQYDRRGELLKVIDVPRWLELDGGKKFFALERIMSNRQSGGKSRALFENVRVGTGVTADLFAPQYMASKLW